MPHLETVAICVVAGNGARLEAAHQNGWSHLLEHMVFKGAGSRSAKELVEVIEARGGQINAATGYERTSFQVRTLSDGIEDAMAVLADLVQRPVLDRDDLEREKLVVEQEIAEAADTPDDLVFEMAQTAAFGDHALGRPILGTSHSIASAGADDLSAWRARLYAPDQLVISVAGAIDPDAILRLAEAHFEGQTDAVAPDPSPAQFRGGEAFADRRLEQSHLVFLLEGVAAGDPDYIAQRLLVEILGGGMSSRLFQEAREKLGLAYAIDAYADTYADVGSVGIYVGCEAGKAGQTGEVIAREICRLAVDLEPEELARAKAQLKAQLFMAREQPLARAEQAAAQIHMFDRVWSPAELSGSIEAVSREQICNLAGRLVESSVATSILGAKSARVASRKFSERLRVGA